MYLTKSWAFKQLAPPKYISFVQFKCAASNFISLSFYIFFCCRKEKFRDENTTGSRIPPDTQPTQANANDPETQACAPVNVHDETAIDSISERKWPSVWTEKQVEDFTEKNPWLYGKNGCLGCSICKDANLAPGHRVQGMSFPESWCNGTVHSYGEDRATQLKALRKKICEHKESKAHKFSADILSKKNQNSLPNIMNQASEEELEATAKVFRSAYFLMKRERPFTDFPHLIDLQQSNGLNMGSVLHSRITAADICDRIGNEMRQKLVSAIKSSGEKSAL